jgi:hypothetical protein
MIFLKNSLRTYVVTGCKLKNFKITIEYDGRSYHGWQRQKSFDENDRE